MKLQFTSKTWNKIIFVVVGLGSLIWFLIRVIPKPSRAMYPCQRAAFPIATGFIIWITTTFGGIFSIRKIKNSISQSRYGLAIFFAVFATISIALSALLVPNRNALANTNPDEPAPVVKSFLESDTNWIEPFTKVAVIKSPKTNSDDITIDEIEAMIRDAVAKAGGFDTLIKEGQTVVIKPNLVGKLEYSGGSVSGRIFPEFNNGIVTNWRVIKAIVKMVREKNSTGKVYVLEGSADGGTTKQIMDYFGYNHDNIPGVTDFICLETRSGAYEDWDSDSLQAVTIPANKALYPNNLKPNKTDKFYLNKIYYSADVLISVPVLKNHSMTSVTGAVKNVGIGATPASIYAGPNDIHRYYNNRIDHSNYTNLQKFIHDWYLCRPVDYAIMDGLQGTDYGPVAEISTTFANAKKNMGMILAGKDAVAVDAIASLLMGYDPSKVSYLVYLNNDTAGTIDPRTICLESPTFQYLKKNFKHSAATTPKYSDFTAPEVSIVNYSIENNTLSFGVNPVDEVVKVEITVNGEKLLQDCIGNFQSISYDLSDYDITSDTSITLKVFDKYLNCAVFNGDKPSRINGISYNSNIIIFPNPARNKITIKSDNLKEGNVQLKIYNTEGKLCNQSTQKKSCGEDLCVNVDELETGNYLLEINSQNLKTVSRFCKK
jgi:uncharacterized protein (DUF362 family)